MNTLIVDVLLGVAVAAQLLCCVGVLAMRSTYDRLHYAGAGSSVAPILVLVALLWREGFSAQGLETIAAVAILVFGGPVAVHAVGRAARRIDYGAVDALPEEKGG